MRGSKTLKLVAAALVVGGSVLVLQALYIPAKAGLAQMLLERAWNRTLAGEVGVKPWPWADIAPVAKLEIARLGWRAIVLDGTSGEAMAFGPGHMTNTPAIGAHGTAIVAAHRDTHFRALRALVPGDLVRARTKRGVTEFRVTGTRIVRADSSGLDPADTGLGGARLALVTCYPFDGVLNSPWRYVVITDEMRPRRRPKGTTLLATSWPISARPR